MAKKKKTGRGRISSVDKLDEDIRVGINNALRERRLTQEEIREHFNVLLKKRGAKPVGRSSFNRYATQIEEKSSLLRESREAADALVGSLKDTGSSDLGMAVTELVKTLTFELMVKTQEGEPIDVDTLNKVALISQRIERAKTINLDREMKIQERARREALEEAADAIEETARQQGMGEKDAQFWRGKVLGIK